MDGSEFDASKNKKHQVHKTGGKITKKNKADAKAGKLQKTNNLKAFTFKSANRARVSIARAANLSERKIHAPIVDRTPVEAPPVIVAIAGPSKVGKTTLLRDLLKHYVKNPVTEIRGPITVVTGKNRRVTFIEVQNDINSMIDAAKVADLILLMIDASFGFEMETFELINICQVHGMPRIMGVLSHMDQLKTDKALKHTKKVLKHRFWTEVYEGAKLFYLSGVVNEHYLPTEVKNLARFISVMKFRPIIWRNAHPYILMDRMEDLTDPEEIRKNDRIDRTVALYGWVRGSHLKNRCAVHIPGVGDLRVMDVAALPDPCPMPGSERVRRTLNDKQRTMYGPFSGIGGLVYDKDAVYIETGGSGAFQKNKKRDELVEAMENVKDTIDEKINRAPLKLLQGMTPVNMDSEEEEDDEAEDDDMSEGDFEDDDDEDEPVNADIKPSGEDWAGLAEKALSQYKGKQRIRVNWMRVVYNENEDGVKNDEQDPPVGIFTQRSSNFNKKAFCDLEDGYCYKEASSSATYLTLQSMFDAQDWNDANVRDSIRDCFVTGKWDPEDMKDGVNSDDEAMGDNAGSEDDGSDDDDYNELANDGENGANKKDKKINETEEEANERRRQMKERLKLQFDAEYDEVKAPYNALKAELDELSKRNKSAFDNMDESQRQQLEGFRPGLYVRVEIENVPVEFIDHFNPHAPYIIGGLLPGEQSIGFVQVRIKKHRWYDRILKSRDPLIISCGWRRFQTSVVYSIQDHNMRNRFIKYTPQNMFCQGIFWAPLVAQNTGFLAVQSVDEQKHGYRLAATGAVLAMDKSVQVVKKLKLVGEPLEIYKNTAFVKGMFNTALEVARFQGAAIRTVSGIRGFIKKAAKQCEGAFRASFEDKIKMSDIVFLRSWATVPLPKFYTAVTDKLLPPVEKWVGMKTVGRLRHELGLKAYNNVDSHYRPVEKPEFVKTDLIIPKKLQRDLPYDLKPKQDIEAAKAVFIRKKTKNEELVEKHTAVILEPHEAEKEEFMDILRTVNHEANEKAKKALEVRKRKHKKEMSEIEDKRQKKRKETQKNVCRKLSQREKHRVKSALEALQA